MNYQHQPNYEQLRSRFEGSEAVYDEQGALRVRVSQIGLHAGFHLSAEIEEIPTPGLGVGRFHRSYPGHRTQRRWKLRAGYVTTFSDHSWKAGYGGWTLYFHPEIVQAVVKLAVQFHHDATAHESLNQVRSLISEWKPDREPQRHVFPEAVDRETGGLRKSEAPPITAPVASGWVTCPYCDKRFKLSDPRRWDGDKHDTCGQRLNIIVPVSS